MHASQEVNREQLVLCTCVLKKAQASPEFGEGEKNAAYVVNGWLNRLLLDHDFSAAEASEEVDGAEREYLLGYRHYLTRQPSMLPLRRFSPQDSMLLHRKLDDKNGYDQATTDPFAVRSLLASSFEGDLDSTKELLTQTLEVTSWTSFDIFAYNKLNPGRVLERVTFSLFCNLRVLRLVDPAKLKKFLKAVEKGHLQNPYHNTVHVADVIQAVGAVLSGDPALLEQLTDLEILSLLIAACVHDLGHPGVTNEFLVRSRAEVATRYNDMSVNENYHLAKAFSILYEPANNFLEGLPEEDFRRLRRMVIELVLNTDMSTHSAKVQEFLAHVSLLGSDLSTWEDDAKLCALSMLLHCCDISNAARPTHLATQWSERILNEFWAQGDREQALGLPVSPLCARSSTDIPRSQLTFLEHFVRPSFEALSMVARESTRPILAQCTVNKAHWERLIASGTNDYR